MSLRTALFIVCACCVSLLATTMTVHTPEGNHTFDLTSVDSVTFDQSGFRYYRFVVEGKIGGSVTATCLVETHFLSGDTAYPPAGDYEIVHHDSIASGGITPLFNGNNTAGTGYCKFVDIPWEWILDMTETRTFESLFIANWETFFYKVPSDVKVYGGSSESGPWTQIGSRVFSASYDTAYVPLTYPQL